MDIKKHTHKEAHYQLLVMHSWRYEIPQEQRNIIIAEALNKCTVDKDFKVYGYLITNRRVFLIGHSKTTPFQKVLQYFYKKVALGIMRYKNRNETYKEKHLLESKVHHNLFTEYPFYNKSIKQSITGHKVEFPYYDPHLKRLQEYIHHHNYCSALDYSGGKSPVIVHQIEA
ncbi:MAG: hypothetical protein AB8B65_07110 [Kordia sp.]|uniref:hypothetical protein n=1 Tax=Kordia sp. TaxID=1965332 RepID=UPI003859DF76